MECGNPFACKKSFPTPEIGGSSVAAAAKDLLRWPVKTRRRGSRSRPPSVVAEPSKRSKPEKSRIESLDLMDLPLKKRICKEPPPATAEGSGGGMIHCFDLNELPQPEDEGEILLALRWHHHDGDGASEMCS